MTLGFGMHGLIAHPVMELVWLWISTESLGYALIATGKAQSGEEMSKADLQPFIGQPMTDTTVFLLTALVIIVPNVWTAVRWSRQAHSNASARL